MRRREDMFFTEVFSRDFNGFMSHVKLDSPVPVRAGDALYWNHDVNSVTVKSST